MLRGGGQENGLRSGTTNTPALAGLAVAAEELNLLRMKEVRRWRDDFEKLLLDAFPKVVIHSQAVARLPNTSAFSIPGTSGEEIAQFLAMDGVIVGTGSACSAGAIHPPRTVLALGIPFSHASATLRVSLNAHHQPISNVELVEKLVNATSRPTAST